MEDAAGDFQSWIFGLIDTTIVVTGQGNAAFCDVVVFADAENCQKHGVEALKLGSVSIDFLLGARCSDPAKAGHGFDGIS